MTEVLRDNLEEECASDRPNSGLHVQDALKVNYGRGIRKTRTLKGKLLSRVEIREMVQESCLKDQPANFSRPKTRGECVDGPRPCLFVSCKYHLYLDLYPESKTIKLNFPDISLENMEETCALDVADKGEQTIQRVAELLNATHGAIELVEKMAFYRARKSHVADDL